MKEVVFNSEEKQAYKYVGRSGDHLHRMTEDQGKKGGAQSGGQGGQSGSGGTQNVKTMALDYGDEVELTAHQAAAFPDRFVPVGKTAKTAKKGGVSATSGDFEPTDQDLADTREFNQETAPVHQERRGGNLINEMDVVVDRTAGPNAFQGAGQITAEHATAFKQEQEDQATSETERMGSVRGAHKTDPNAPRPGAGAAQASGQGPSGTGVLKPDQSQGSSSGSKK
jgi:hypothetical protein